MPEPKDKNEAELIKQARLLAFQIRRTILLGIGELALQKDLAEMFRRAEPGYGIYVTQGPNELGKDLVLIKSDMVTTNVVGVVVKCGPVTGKVLEGVDAIKGDLEATFKFNPNRNYREIRCQALQAYANAAAIPDSFGTYKVNKVIVIVNGEISNNARTRLAAEIAGDVEDIHGIRWLVDKFTEFYPEVFFEGQVTGFIDGKISELETRHTPLNSNKALSEYFVEPVVQTSHMALDFADLKTVFERKKLPFSSLRPLVDKRKRMFVIGDPGTGKSAALSKLTIDMLREEYGLAAKKKSAAERISLPILISSCDLLDIKSPDDLLDYYFGNSTIHDRVDVRVLLIDALDETNSSHRQEIIDKATKFADHFNSSLIITSRNIEAAKVPPAGFEKYELLPFGICQALDLMKKIGAGSNVFSTLRAGLENIKHQIPMVPLSLLLLVELVVEYKEIPASVTELYDRYVDIALGKEDRSKGIEVLFEYHVKKKFLSELAYKYFVPKKTIEVSEAEFEEFLEIFSKRHRIAKDNIERFVSEIERAGILHMSDGVVMFRHRSFLDYFSGFYIADHREQFDDLETELVKIYFDDDSGEITFFYIGLLKKIGVKLLNRILDYPDESFSANLHKLDIGRLLQAGWFSNTEIKERGIKGAFDYLDLVRTQLKTLARKSNWEQASFLSELIVLFASEHSFRSVFLEQELKSFYKEISAESNNPTALVKRVAALWVLRPFLDAPELRLELESVLTQISENKLLPPEDSVVLASVIAIIDQRKSVITKGVTKRIHRIYDQHAKELYKLLPPDKRKSGFRPPTR